MSSAKPRHFTCVEDLTPTELGEVLDLSSKLKADSTRYGHVLQGKSLALIFQKPSTRTRTSFQVGISQLGGHSVVLNQQEIQLGRGETVADTARVLSRYVDGIVARVFDHTDIEQLASHATVSVVNGLCDLLHPCQAVCDYFTMQEHFGQLAGLRVAYLGDGNNMAHSLALAGGYLGVHLTIATPGNAYAPEASIIERARDSARASGARILTTNDPHEAVANAQVVYTDVWTSMGQENESQQRRSDLAAFQVNLPLFSKAAKDAVFMHCLPAHYGEEVTPEVTGHARSIIFDQAENRLHTQKAILIFLMESEQENTLS